jgi:glycosyltransferase involved in cell wall biosynthesis
MIINRPKISVVTICYNACNVLEQTILSVVNQTYTNIEYLIIDGNSKDNSIEIIHKYANHISYWVSEPDKGIYDAMNKGIKAASGEWIIFMNAGDLFYNEFSVEKSVPYLTEDMDVVSGVSYLSSQRWIPPTNDELSVTFFVKKSLNHQATFIRRSLFKEEQYRTDLKIVSDSIFFFKTLILNNAKYLNIPVEVASCEDAGMSGNAQAGFQELTSAIKGMLPPRMKNDIDFIIVYHNPAVLSIGKILYRSKILKSILRFIRKSRKVRCVF